MLTGFLTGFITPNRRWVAASGVALAGSIFPELREEGRDYIDTLLAEKIDINFDGDYSERSTGVYNAVCNRCFRILATELGRPELLDPVRRNFHLTTLLIEPDGTILTSLSNRQDQGQHFFPLTMADGFFALGNDEDRLR